MAVWKAIILFIVLLAVRVQYVACPTDSLLLNMDNAPAPQLEISPLLPQPENEDPCFRILGLKLGPREDNTLFWWFLCISSAGNAVWWCYFSACFSLSASVLPILLASILGAVLNIILTFVATFRTSTPGFKFFEDIRHYVTFTVPFLCFMVAYGMKKFPVQYTGWFGFALTGLSQSFRVASSLSFYLGNFNRWQFFASVLGAVGGCSWTIRPQLCVSREYKIISYAIAIIRGTEAIIWCSGAIARQLRRLEGQNVAPPEDSELQDVV